MTTHGGVERRVRQLDADVQDIYLMLSQIAGTQLRQGNRLEEIDLSVGVLSGRIDGIDTRLDGIDARLDGIDARLGTMEGKLDTVIDLLGSGPAG